MIRAKHIVIVAAVLFLVACMEPPPDWIDHAGWTTTGDAPPGGADELAVALQTIRERAPFEVPDAWWGGVIRFAPVIFNDPRVAGKWTGGGFKPQSAEFAIATVQHFADGTSRPLTRIEDTALTHEVGHYLWSRAGIANMEHPQVFQAWWASVNVEIARRLGR